METLEGDGNGDGEGEGDGKGEGDANGYGDGDGASESGPPSEEADVPFEATNVIMYALGERYDISALKDLAEHKLGAHEFTEWSDQLPEVIELVYTTTPDSDRRLRDIIRHTCEPHTSSLIQNPDILDVMLRVPSFSVDFCKGCLAFADHRSQQDKEKVQQAQEEAYKAKGEADLRAAETASAFASMAITNRKLSDVQELINSITSCRNCREEFTPLKIDPIGSWVNSPVVMRCSKCKTKHRL